MTLRQRLLKLIYPLFVWVRQQGTKEKVLHNKKMSVPPVPFHSLSATLNNGTTLSFDKLKGKKVLLVNTASDCGYTKQYMELQTLYQQAKEEVEIIAFPANDFRQQEKGSDEEIARFCTMNYGVHFSLTKKAVVVKGASQHPIYQWLTNPLLNGWNSKEPSWNFAKFLVTEEGVLSHYFEPSVSPVGAEVLHAIMAKKP